MSMTWESQDPLLHITGKDGGLLQQRNLREVALAVPWCHVQNSPNPEGPIISKLIALLDLEYLFQISLLIRYIWQRRERVSSGLKYLFESNTSQALSLPRLPSPEKQQN